MSVRGESAFTSKKWAERKRKDERRGKEMRKIVYVKSGDAKRERVRG